MQWYQNLPVRGVSTDGRSLNHGIGPTCLHKYTGPDALVPDLTKSQNYDIIIQNIILFEYNIPTIHALHAVYHK